MFVRSVLKVVCINMPPTYSSLECVAFDVMLSAVNRYVCIYNPQSSVNSVDIEAGSSGLCTSFY